MAANDTQNPYLALLQQQAGPPSWAQILQHVGNLGFGLAGGFGQAAATGQPTMAAIGPGLMMGNQMNAQAAHRAEQERMQRLEWQFKAQEHEDKRAELLRNQAAIDAYVKAPGFQVAPPQGSLMGPSGTPTPQGPTTGDAASRISGIESGGRYDAVGPVANRAGNRAYGKYQVMDFNIGPWTQEVLGKPMTPQEFLADTKAQDAVFNAKFGAYQQKYGPAGAARAWFAGEGGMNNPNAKDVLGTSVADYERKFTGGPPAPQVAQGDAVAAPPQPQPRPGPTLSALPAFEGPGMGTIQPGALPDGVLPSIVPPAQVAQGDSVTPSGARIDPSAQPPQFMQPGGAGPNVVQAQATPGPNTPLMAPGGSGPAPGGVDAPPIFVQPPMRDIPPEVNAQINRLVGLPRGVGLTIAQAEEKKHQLRMEQWKTDTEAAKAQHASALEVYKQQKEGARHERGEQAKRDAEERAQARQLEAEQRREAGEQQRHDRDAAERQKAREDAAKQSGDKQSLELTKAQRDQENKLRDDFNGLKPVQDFRKADLVFQSAQNAAKTDTAAADLNLVYAFATMMDPGSVVRDQETGMVVATQNASDRVKAMVASVSGGSRIQPEAKKALVAEMGSRHSGYKEAHDAYATATEEIATRQGLDPRNVVARVVVKKPNEEKPATPPSDTFPAPPPAAIKALQMAPNQREDFDKMFGPGAAAKVLGR